MTPLKKTTLFFFFLLFLFPDYACHRRIKGEAQNADKIEEMQEERKKEAEKEYKMALKRHMEIQTKDTRKRIKRSRKRSERIMAGKPPEPFFKRLFSKKARKVKAKPTDK